MAYQLVEKPTLCKRAWNFVKFAFGVIIVVAVFYILPGMYFSHNDASDASRWEKIAAPFKVATSGWGGFFVNPKPEATEGEAQPTEEATESEANTDEAPPEEPASEDSAEATEPEPVTEEPAEATEPEPVTEEAAPPEEAQAATDIPPDIPEGVWKLLTPEQKEAALQLLQEE